MWLVSRIDIVNRTIEPGDHSDPQTLSGLETVRYLLGWCCNYCAHCSVRGRGFEKFPKLVSSDMTWSTLVKDINPL